MKAMFFIMHENQSLLTADGEKLIMKSSLPPKSLLMQVQQYRNVIPRPTVKSYMFDNLMNKTFKFQFIKVQKSCKTRISSCLI